jgi:hypothetical protein
MRRNYVQVVGLGGEVYQIAVHPRSSDYHCDQTGNLEQLGHNRNKKSKVFPQQ